MVLDNCGVLYRNSKNKLLHNSSMKQIKKKLLVFFILFINYPFFVGCMFGNNPSVTKLTNYQSLLLSHIKVRERELKCGIELPKPCNNLTGYQTEIPMYVITVKDKKSLPRVLHFLENCYFVTPNVKFFPAVDGRNKVQVEEVVAEKFSFFNDVKAGALGCLLSHLKAIKYAYFSNEEMVIMAEDDVECDLVPYWTNSLENLASDLPSTWEVVQLEYRYRYTKGRKKFVYIEQLFSQNVSGWGTASYMIHRRGIEKLMNILYDFKQKKFVVSKMKEGCGKEFSADRCLLNFAPSEFKRVYWLNNEPALKEIYQATPPFFSHALDIRSLIGYSEHKVQNRNLIFTESFCADIESNIKKYRIFCDLNFF